MCERRYSANHIRPKGSLGGCNHQCMLHWTRICMRRIEAGQRLWAIKFIRRNAMTRTKTIDRNRAMKHSEYIEAFTLRPLSAEGREEATLVLARWLLKYTKQMAYDGADIRDAII